MMKSYGKSLQNGYLQEVV